MRSGRQRYKYKKMNASVRTLLTLLTLNAGSSSIKFALFDLTGTLTGTQLEHQARLRGKLDGIGSQPRLTIKTSANEVLLDTALDQFNHLPLSEQHPQLLKFLLAWLKAHDAVGEIAAVGHRVVHGGEQFLAPVIVDNSVLDDLSKLIPLAPLHQPHNIAGIRALSTLLPNVPQIACFDTAFHHTQPDVARHFALPRNLTEQGIKRYGFHGLSYEYIAQTLPQHLGAKADGRIVVAHIGNGASMCALKNRQSIATTMGYTALDGLMMGTRCGAIDPGVLLYLMTTHHMDAAQITHLLYEESGLLGVSGISQDMRTLLKSDAPAAHEAIELFCYRVSRELGSMAAALGGLDALVFTAGIGEQAAAVREKICHAAAWLGVKLDSAANNNAATHISAANSTVEVLVIPTNEEWILGQHVKTLLSL